jgi:hypothetical protein
MNKIRNGMIGALGFALVVLPAAASAEFQPTPEQRSACMGDAMRLCSSVLFSGDRVVSCLLSKKSQLSPRCRALADKS